MLDLDGTEIDRQPRADGAAGRAGQASRGGGDVKIATTNAINRKILEITRLDQQLEVFDSVIDAVKSFQLSRPCAPTASSARHVRARRPRLGRAAATCTGDDQLQMTRLDRAAARTAAASCWAKSSSTCGFCTEDQIVECLAAEYGVPYAKLEARLLRSQGRRRAAARVHRKQPGAAAVRRPRHADDRGLRAVEPVPDRRDRGADATSRCRSSPPRRKTSGG